MLSTQYALYLTCSYLKHIIVKSLGGVILACIMVLITLPAASASDNKILYLADWDGPNGLIWKMDLQAHTVLGSFAVEVGSPTGLALLDDILYVNVVSDNIVFAFNPHTGEQVSETTGLPLLDGLAAIPEARLIAGIEPSRDLPERLHLYKPSAAGYSLEQAYDPVVVDVPGYAVRGLAYAGGELFISEESTGTIYVYDLDLTGPTPLLTYDRALAIDFRAPGLAFDGNNLVAYDICDIDCDIENKLIKTVSPSTGTIISWFSLKGTGIGDIVAGLEVGPFAVRIDIKPGSFPNSIYPKSPGVIPVAILTTDSSDNFPASTVDPATVLFGRTGAEAKPVRVALKDVDGDGDIDMILHFNIKDTGIACGDAIAALTGSTFDEQAIKGTDSIKTVFCR